MYTMMLFPLQVHSWSAEKRWVCTNYMSLADTARKPPYYHNVSLNNPRTTGFLKITAWNHQWAEIFKTSFRSLTKGWGIAFKPFFWSRQGSHWRCQDIWKPARNGIKQAVLLVSRASLECLWLHQRKVSSSAQLQASNESATRCHQEAIMPAETEPSFWLSCKQDSDGCYSSITPTLTRSRSFLLLRAENKF